MEKKPVDALFLLGIVTVVIVALCTGAGCGSSTDVTVPKVTGLSVIEAQAKLSQAGFKSKITYSTGEKSTQGTVTAQSPKADSKAKKGAVVTLTIAKQAGSSTPGPSSTSTTPGDTGSTSPGNTNSSTTTGSETEKVKVTCTSCGGSGVITTTVSEQVTATCPTCGGSGTVTDASGVHACPTCGGSGQVTETRMVERQETCPACAGVGFIWVSQ